MIGVRWHFCQSAFTFLRNVTSFLTNTMPITASFIPTLNVAVFFLFILDHIFYTEFSPGKTPATFCFLNFRGILEHPPWTQSNPSICLTTCPLMPSKHTTKLSALSLLFIYYLHYVYLSYFLIHHENIVFLLFPLCRVCPQINPKTSSKTKTIVITLLSTFLT